WRRMVRETAALAPEEAIRKLTALPAERIGLRDRGRIAQGFAADLAIFDPARFRDRGTLFNPSQLADGMVHVVVNGRIALRDERAQPDRFGMVLRPSRSG
ncbi:MAG: amidohydrolase family protein, partial [Elioraea sp.]|nr:amidohydrolase family protein [Elioraea sp.]